MVIMPGEALVVNLARPARALRAPAPGIVVRDPRQRARWPWDRIQTGAESSGDPGHLVCILSVVYPQTIQARRINAFK